MEIKIYEKISGFLQMIFGEALISSCPKKFLPMLRLQEEKISSSLLLTVITITGWLQRLQG